jgi:hypothetical protein
LWFLNLALVGVLNQQCIQKESAVRIGLFVLAKGRIFITINVCID